MNLYYFPLSKKNSTMNENCIPSVPRPGFKRKTPGKSAIKTDTNHYTTET